MHILSSTKRFAMLNIFVVNARGRRDDRLVKTSVVKLTVKINKSVLKNNRLVKCFVTYCVDSMWGDD